jgi:hypothetical protein
MTNHEQLPAIVKRALVETVTDIGQLSKTEIDQLNKYVKRGWLSKGRGGAFPILKTVYAFSGYDFAAWRQRYVDRAMNLAELDRIAHNKRNCGCGKIH